MAGPSYDDGPLAMGGDTDNHGEYYAAMASTATEVKVREAAMKFVVAESHVKEGEAYEEALRSANKALALFRDVRHRIGVADSLRLIIHAYHLKADLLPGKESRETMRQAVDLASEHAAVFQRLGDKRSEAAMLLSLAEVHRSSDISAKRKQAANSATEAQSICKEDGDKKLEATALLVLCDIYLDRRSGEAAVKAALEARTLFIAVKDGVGEAKAMHALGAARACIGELAEGILATQQAQALYRSLELRRQAAWELFNVARLCVETGDVQEALSAVKTVQKDIAAAAEAGDIWLGWLAAASSFEVQALIVAGRLQDAAGVAEARLDMCPKNVDVKHHLWALRSVARALHANGRVDQAVKTVQEALRICGEELGGDMKWETGLTLLAAEMFSQGGKFAEAATWAQKACEKFGKAGDKLGEVKAMHLLGLEYIKKKDPVAALKVSRQGRMLASKSDQQRMEGTMLLLAANAHLQMGEEEEGMGCAQEAASILHQANDKRGEMETCKLVAAIYRANSEFHEADQAARRAQGVARDLDDKLTEIDLLKWQSHCHAEAGNTKSALRAAKDAARVGKNQSQNVQAESLLLVSHKYLEHLSAEAKRLDEPEKLIVAKADLVLKPGAEAIAMAKAVGDKLLTCFALLIQGQVANQVFRHDEAFASYQESLTLAQDLHDEPCEAAAYIMGAEARYGLGRMDLAIELAGKALPIARKIKDTGVQERCKRFVSVSSKQGGGGRRHRRKIGVKKVKRMVEKRVGGGGSNALQLTAVKDMSMRVLGDLAEEQIAFDDPLMDAGMDSLSAITFRDKLSKETGIKLPGTLMFDHPTLGDVAGFIVDRSVDESGGGGGEERIEMVEEEFEESEYEEVSDDDDDYRSRGRRRRKIGTKKVKKRVQRQVAGSDGGEGLQLAAVKDMSMRVLGDLAEEQVTFDDPLMDAGMDSLSAITFRDKLTKETGIKLPGTLMFDHPTLADVADFIVDTSIAAGAGAGVPQLQWVEEEVEESEYEDIDEEDNLIQVIGKAEVMDREPVSKASTAVAVRKGLELADVKVMAMSVLTGLSDGVEIGLDDPLMDSGLDSLAAVTFRNDLMKQSGVKLPGTIMFDHPTLLAVSEFIMEESVRALD